MYLNPSVQKLRAVFIAAECSPDCTDPGCHFTHRDSWHVWQKDIYIEGPFDTKEVADAYIETNEPINVE